MTENDTTKPMPQVSRGPFDDLRVSFSAEHLPRLFPFLGIGDIRYYLAGIHVARAPQGGAYLVATNGHALAVIHDREATIEGAEFITLRVGRPILAAAGQAKRRGNRHIPYRVQVHGQRLMVSAADAGEVSDLELYVQPGKCVIECNYPKWPDVIPDFATLQRGGFTGPVAVNPRYLGLFEGIGGSKWPGIVLWEPPAKDRVVVQVMHVPEMVAVIMPMRAEPDEFHRGKLPALPERSKKAAPAEAPAADAERVNRDAEAVPG